MDWAFKILLLFTASVLMGCAKNSQNESNSPPPYQGRPLKVSDFPNVENTAYGVWAADNADFGNGLYYVLNIYLNDHGDVGFGRTCGGHGDVISANMVLNGMVTDRQIEVTESARVTVASKKISECTLSIQAGVLNYSRTADDKLIVEFEPGKFHSFSRNVD